MADIELVVKIDEEFYKSLNHYQKAIILNTINMVILFEE